MNRNLLFYKTEDGRWFVNLPEWEGEIDDLEMVCGADVLLDIISNNHFDSQESISIKVFTEKMDADLDRTHYTLTIMSDDLNSGATYILYHPLISPFEIWLCDVTKFVFNGIFPRTIYFEA